MMNYLLDTNHASPLVTLNHPLRAIILAQIPLHSFGLCIPVITETLFGISLLPRATQNRTIWFDLQKRFPCYIHDADDAVFAAELQRALRRQGKQLATIDALIAAIALRHDLVLLTRDHDFQAIPTLRQENWLI